MAPAAGERGSDAPGAPRRPGLGWDLPAHAPCPKETAFSFTSDKLTKTRGVCPVADGRGQWGESAQAKRQT